MTADKRQVQDGAHVEYGDPLRARLVHVQDRKIDTLLAVVYPSCCFADLGVCMSDMHREMGGDASAQVRLSGRVPGGKAAFVVTSFRTKATSPPKHLQSHALLCLLSSKICS